MSGATDVGSVFPDDLREVSPQLEVIHGGLSLAIEPIKPADFAVVEQVGDDGRDVVCLDTGSDVLAVPSATGSTTTH